jgi:hypothetical protein
MEFTAILKLIQAANAMIGSIAPIVAEVKKDLSSSDQDALKAALAEMQIHTDTLHAETQSLLRG